jgi:hypothetical protein
MKVDERQFRFFEVSFYIMTIALIVLLAIVLYFVGEKPKMCIDYLPTPEEQVSEYDVNKDGEVDVSDILEKIDEANAIRDYILNN